MKMIYVRWRDAGSDRTARWREADGLDMRIELHSAGFLVYENDEVITLAADCDGERYRDITSIPTSCILEKRLIPVSEET